MEVRAERVSKRYARSVTALDAVSFDVAGPTSLAVVGPSGSGKSTLLRLVAGLEWPTRGRVRVDGRSPRRARAVGHVPQRTDLDPAASALQGVVAGRLDPHLRGRAEALLAQLGVRTSAPVRELPAGDQRLVVLARTLVTGPRLLLADEPTAGLDAAARSRVVDLLLSTVDSGTLLLLATHDPEVAVHCAGRLVLEAGRLRRV